MTTPIEQIEKGLQALPGLAPPGIGIQVSDVALLGSGFEADIYVFNADLVPHGPDTARIAPWTRELVLRVYGGEGAAQKCSHEFHVMRRLREAAYPVPRVFLHGESPQPFGGPFLVMERIRGVSLGSLYWSADPERRRRSEAVLLELMARLHSLAAASILPGDPLVHTPGDVPAAEIAALSTLLARMEGHEPPSLGAVLAWLEAQQVQVPCDRLSVLHGDFHPNNVLLDIDAPYVIDWSNSRIGDCRIDLAWTRLILRTDDRPDRGASMVHRYAHLAQRQVERLEFFDVAASLRLLLSVLISLKFGATRQGMRAEAGDLMRADDSHLWYAAAVIQDRTGLPMPDLESAIHSLFDH